MAAALTILLCWFELRMFHLSLCPDKVAYVYGSHVFYNDGTMTTQCNRTEECQDANILYEELHFIISLISTLSVSLKVNFELWVKHQLLYIVNKQPSHLWTSGKFRNFSKYHLLLLNPISHFSHLISDCKMYHLNFNSVGDEISVIYKTYCFVYVLIDKQMASWMLYKNILYFWH